MKPVNEGGISDRNERQHWMAVLARAELTEIESAWSRLHDKPAYRVLRRPETGLVMARGRIGGDGAPFNLGEVAVTRCAVQMPDGRTGFAYVAGRAPRKSELAAVFDGMLQDDSRRAALMAEVIEPLAQTQQQRRAAQHAAATRTKVNFFALARGEDAR